MGWSGILVRSIFLFAMVILRAPMAPATLAALTSTYDFLRRIDEGHRARAVGGDDVGCRPGRRCRRGTRRGSGRRR